MHTDCYHTSRRDQLFWLYLEEMGPHFLLKKRREIVLNWAAQNVHTVVDLLPLLWWSCMSFCKGINWLVSHQVLFTCILKIVEKAGLGLPVAVHNVPWVIQTLFCQPYMYRHEMRIPHSWNPFHRSCALPSPEMQLHIHIHPQVPAECHLYRLPMHSNIQTTKHVGYASIFCWVHIFWIRSLNDKKVKVKLGVILAPRPTSVGDSKSYS